MTQRKIGKSWWVDITHDHVRYRKKSPDNSKAGALVYESHLRRKLAEGVSVEQILQQSKQSQPFDEFAHFWFKTYVLVNNRPSVIVKSKAILDKKLIPFFGKTPLNKISTLQVEQYKAQQAGEGLVATTINSELHVLGKCLRDAQEWLELHKIPKMKMLKVPPLENDFLTEEECEILLPQMQGLWYDLVYTALKTGLRLGELKGLKWQDIQWENMTLTVKRTWCTIAKSLLSPKGNKERTIPLTDDVHTLLLRRRQKEGFVFKGKNGVFNGRRLNYEIAQACKRAGLRKVTCHILRHSYASHLALKGVPIIVIQKLLGHSDIKVTMRYAHLSKSSVNEAVEVIQKPYSPSLKASPEEEEKESSTPHEEQATSTRHEESVGVFEEHDRPERQQEPVELLDTR